MGCRFVLVLTVLLAAVPLRALAITYTSGLRTIHEGILGGSDSTDQYGPWEVEETGFGCLFETECGSVTVSQISDLAQSSIFISSSIEGSTDDGPEPNGSSTLSATFSLDHPLAFTATGFYFATGSFAWPVGLEIFLVGSQGEVLAISDLGDYIEGEISGSGVLPAGEYHLDVNFFAGHWEGVNARSDFALDFEEVPEPRSLALVATGLLGVVFGSRGRRRDPSDSCHPVRSTRAT